MKRDSDEMKTTLANLTDALTSLTTQTKGVRLDLLISLPNMPDLWCDFTGIHPTAKNSIRKLQNFLVASGLGHDVAAGVVANNPTARQPSPAVVNATALKKLRYQTMLELAAAQVSSHRRCVLPKLVPGIVTHLGELGPDLINLVETITAAAGKQFRLGKMSRGMSKSKLTAIFRTKLKDGVLAANAEGFGQALVAAGNPIAGWVVAPDDFDWDSSGASWIVNY